MATINTRFNTNISGPPPGTATIGSSQWIDLGLIPSGNDIWIGNATFSSPDKTIAFSIYTNTMGKSTSGTSNCTQLTTCSVSTKSGSLYQDYYKNGRLHISTVRSTGVEHWWLYLTSKTNTAGSYIYSINYTQE